MKFSPATQAVRDRRELRQLNKRVGRTLLAELFGTPATVDPGLRRQLRREPAHGAEGISRPELNAEATEAINEFYCTRSGCTATQPAGTAQICAFSLGHSGKRSFAKTSYIVILSYQWVDRLWTGRSRASNSPASVVRSTISSFAQCLPSWAVWCR